MSIINLSQIAQALDAMMPELTPVPVGTIDFAHDVPDGWLECNGAAISRTKYSRLFKKLGTKYGAGDGSTTFNLPNLHHRVLEATTTISEVAKTVEAGLPDITGWVDIDTNGSSECIAFNAAGAFSKRRIDNPYGNFAQYEGARSVKYHGRVDMSAKNVNAIYSKSQTAQMASLCLLAIIKI